MTVDITAIVVAGLTGLPATIAALAAWRVGKTNGKKATVITEKTESIEKKTDSIKEITETSAHSVNGNFAAIKNELSIAIGHNVALQETIKTLTSILNTRHDNLASEFNKQLLKPEKKS